MSLYLGNDLISGSKPINLGVRNIGEIVYSSLPLTDAGLHLLDGSLILGGGIYQGFIDYIADLYTQDPTAKYFTTEALWQTAVTTYGVCGKFVYDSVNNTVRLPKVTGIIEGTVDASALGDLVEAGLPNITGAAVLLNGGNSGDGAIYVKGVSTVTNVADGSNTYCRLNTMGFDASRSSSIYGNSSTVQPQTIKCFVYIVIANSSKTEIQVDIDEVATDLNGKADTDLTNATDQAKILMGGMAMPSNKYIDLTLGASGTEYVAPANGWFYIDKLQSGYENVLALAYPEMVNGAYIFSSYLRCVGNSYSQQLSIPVRKGQPVKCNYDSNGTCRLFRFYYAVGSESEAS